VPSGQGAATNSAIALRFLYKPFCEEGRLAPYCASAHRDEVEDSIRLDAEIEWLHQAAARREVAKKRSMA
jgi:hypothetical protein